VRIAFAKAIYATLEAYVRGSTELTFRLKYAQLASETNASKSIRTGYITEISDVVQSDGTEVEASFAFAFSSLPKFTAGT
jgi:hypothetical protein